ncbi:TldD/PmbA family protein [Sunxiuqinia elliptica]|uniref:Microcin-processing peptidase 2 n=1 Tax=Sunxiuqinia elliptica TaxID=655355 RepID=A0A4V3BYT5_9BACT|nr:TldD/PmbA family protein [Sunxiuqinia elliptica]TDO03819.1 microcin-processing peptidase 2 [Sunxiuqinia elliptica]TDO62101.1 microcin-processing peptidase 2 [Sunxiuqinia elliptica]
MRNIDRRKFLKSSGSAVVGSMLLPAFVQSCQGASVSAEIQAYLEHFGVDLKLLQKVTEKALSKGGDYADLFFEHKIVNSLGLEDGKVNRAFSNIDFGVGIRVLKGDQTGFAYSETITPEAMLKAANTAANIASGSQAVSAQEIKEAMPANYYTINKSWEDVSVPEKIPFIQKLNDQVFELDSRVSKVNAFLNDESAYVMFYSSEGVLTYDYRPMVSLGVVCVMEQNGQLENSYSARSFRKGFEFLNQEVVDLLANEVVDRTALLFDATKPKAGEMPVVMGAGGSGILLHEAIGHTFEADFNRKGTSIFADKMGKKVAENFVNIVDDGTLAENRGSINMDDEGNRSEKTYLVKDGILNSYIHDRISARHYQVDPTGNGRRESFRHVPLPRMRATYMETGPHSREDIISDVKKGIYVDNFSNGEVKIGAGDFTFYVKSGYLIENGKLTQPIKDINIIGNGPQALADITMCASDYKIDNGTWTCGKSGQSVPVTCGLPTVLVKKLTVGGVS